MEAPSRHRVLSESLLCARPTRMKERLDGTCYHWVGPLGSEGSGADTGESSRNFQVWPGATAFLLATAPSALRVCSIDFGFPGGSVVKNHLPKKKKNPHLIPRLGRSPRVGSGNPLQYSCLEKSMDRGAWWAIIQGVLKESDTTEVTDTSTNFHLCIYIFSFVYFAEGLTESNKYIWNATLPNQWAIFKIPLSCCPHPWVYGLDLCCGLVRGDHALHRCTPAPGFWPKVSASCRRRLLNW